MSGTNSHNDVTVPLGAASKVILVMKKVFSEDASTASLAMLYNTLLAKEIASYPAAPGTSSGNSGTPATYNRTNGTAHATSDGGVCAPSVDWYVWLLFSTFTIVYAAKTIKLAYDSVATPPIIHRRMSSRTEVVHRDAGHSVGIKAATLFKIVFFPIHLLITHSIPLVCSFVAGDSSTVVYVQACIQLVVVLLALAAHYPVPGQKEPPVPHKDDGFLKALGESTNVNQSDLLIVSMYHTVIKFLEAQDERDCTKAMSGVGLTAFIVFSLLAKVKQYVKISSNDQCSCGCQLEFVPPASCTHFMVSTGRTLVLIVFLITSNTLPLRCFLDASDLTKLSYAHSGLSAIASALLILSHISTLSHKIEY
eukprot:scpid72662/ scgid13142/ 